jgi:DNA-binding beta-propeller fold protein YncE
VFAVGANGDVYVADFHNNRIQVFSSSGEFLRQWGSPETFSGPACVALDASGDVYVADYYVHRIQKFTSTGTFMGSGAPRAAETASSSIQTGVPVDAASDLYVDGFPEPPHPEVHQQRSIPWRSWGSLGGGDGPVSGSRPG